MRCPESSTRTILDERDPTKANAIHLSRGTLRAQLGASIQAKQKARSPRSRRWRAPPKRRRRRRCAASSRRRPAQSVPGGASEGASDDELS
eukprot:5147026-Pleurochrysis_carterae.AAC.1